ncbi:MAG TPA: 50S ribosomal protein L4 [Gammaproteobacteria bacterium]|jgi:large subunit ribosomal protein L4|nr:50S ribosomal protein L4 [Gammaproteobacteria bacterium]
MEHVIANSKNKIELADAIFACEFNEPLIHQVVTAYMAAARAGTKAQKTRSEVSGGGIKPFAQKGGGRARAGTIRSPIWRKGGVTFAAKPRCFKQKVNKKMHRGALRSILSELIRQDRLMVVETFVAETAKTKDMKAKLAAMNLTGNVMIVTESIDESVYLAARNLPHVALLDVPSCGADPVSLVSADKVVITQAAIKELEELLK